MFCRRRQGSIPFVIKTCMHRLPPPRIHVCHLVNTGSKKAAFLFSLLRDEETPRLHGISFNLAECCCLDRHRLSYFTGFSGMLAAGGKPPADGSWNRNRKCAHDLLRILRTLNLAQRQRAAPTAGGCKTPRLSARSPVYGGKHKRPLWVQNSSCRYPAAQRQGSAAGYHTVCAYV